MLDGELAVPCYLKSAICRVEFQLEEFAEVIQFINDDIIRIGLSKYAIENLSEIVYIELEQIGETYEKGNEIVIIESVKAASCICAPADGTILAHNNDVVDNIEDYNNSSYDGTRIHTLPDNNNKSRSLFIFDNNKCNLGCCPSVYSCDNGCVCTTETQNNYISKRGNNHSIV